MNEILPKKTSIKLSVRKEPVHLQIGLSVRDVSDYDSYFKAVNRFIGNTKI